MTDLIPITALGGSTPRIDRIGSLTITEVPDVALASVAARRGGEKATLAAIRKLIGTDAPGPGKSAGKGEITAIWSGPEQWMLHATGAEFEDLPDRAVAAAKGKASVTEQSGAWVQFDIAGECVLDLFERLSAVPVREMAPGDATRSRIEHLGAFVICTDAGFTILGARSSAGSLHHALTTAARSVA